METVTVACKLPNGIVIRGERLQKKRIVVPGAGEIFEEMMVPDGRVAVINGNAVDREKVQKAPPEYEIVGGYSTGYALTTGVPKDLWDQFFERMKDEPLVKDGHVFAHKQTASARSFARQHLGLRTGLEPVDPESPPGEVRMVQRGTRTEN